MGAREAILQIRWPLFEKLERLCDFLGEVFVDWPDCYHSVAYNTCLVRRHETFCCIPPVFQQKWVGLVSRCSSKNE